ncbi:hypothetical protein, partial [Ruegeria halocynthiae]|uniref:hypothetical protein n=1 Tax=Ruegeria halocynthiae TaxID=985054 RepID=UPI001C40A887
PFTGAAEALVTHRRGGGDGPERRLDASERRWASEVVDWAVSLIYWRYGLVFGSGCMFFDIDG